MRPAEIAVRYAKALYDLNKGPQERLSQELRVVNEALTSQQEVMSFMTSPLVSADEREAVIGKTIEKLDLSEQIKNLLLLLARKGRIGIFPSLVEAYEARADEAGGIVRGEVHSAVALAPEERKKIENKVSEVTQKQAILTYRENPEVIGGLIAHVGSFTFDDTLQSHLQRLQENLKRSI